MPFIKRNSDGQIVAITQSLEVGGDCLPVDHPELLGFLASSGISDAENLKGLEMLSSDLKMIRVIEDVIDILISKNLIIFSDLPLAVQEKLLLQKGRRERLFGAGVDIIGREDGIL